MESEERSIVHSQHWGAHRHASCPEAACLSFCDLRNGHQNSAFAAVLEWNRLCPSPHLLLLWNRLLRSRTVDRNIFASRTHTPSRSGTCHFRLIFDILLWIGASTWWSWFHFCLRIRVVYKTYQEEGSWYSTSFISNRFRDRTRSNESKSGCANPGIHCIERKWVCEL